MTRVIRAATAALFMLAFASSAVLAHAELETAEPGDDEVVVGSPAELVTTWTQDLDPSRTSLDVRAPDGSRVVRGGTIDAADPRLMTLALPELAPGTYEVRWTSFSAEDGELARGRFRFTVEAEPTPTPTAPPSATPGADASAPQAPTEVPSAAPTPTPAAVASPAPETPPAGDSALSIVLPIVVAALAVIGVAAWILKRR